MLKNKNVGSQVKSFLNLFDSIMNINSLAPPKIILTFCGTDKAGLWMGEHSVQREVANTINIQSWEYAHSTYDVEFWS